MSPSIADTCARVAAELNPPGQPFTYRCEGQRVIGTWDIADVTYQGLLSAGTIDKDYELTVTLDEGDGTYTFTERKVESESEVRLSGGKIEFGGSKTAFKGKSIGKQWGGGAALLLPLTAAPAPAAGSAECDFDYNPELQPGLTMNPASGKVTSHGETGTTWSYEFETARIKEPLLVLLHDMGWRPAKRGFFARLFSN